MIKNMTTGSPARLLVSFALPVLAGGLVYQGYTMADAVIVGQKIGVEGFAAIGAVDNIHGLIIGFGMMMVQGFGILIAQRFGADDKPGLHRAVAVSFWMTLLSGLLLTVLALATLDPFMRALQVPGAIYDSAYGYIAAIMATMLVPMLTRMGYVTLQSLGDSRTPFVAMMLSSLLNIGLDALLILGLGFGIRAAAVATVLSQALVWPWLLLRLRRIGLLRRTGTERPAAPVRRLLGLSVPIALQNSVAVVGVILLQAVVNGMGVLAVAAFTVVMRIFYFMKEPAQAMHHALTSYAGQNIGAKNLRRVREGLRVTVVITLGVCAAAMLVMILLARPIIGWVIAPEEIAALDMAVLLLRILAGMLPVLYLMYAFRAVLQGVGCTGTLLASGGVELVMRSVCALTLPALLGFWGVGIAETSAWLGALLLYVVRYVLLLRKRAGAAAP